MLEIIWLRLRNRLWLPIRSRYAIRRLRAMGINSEYCWNTGDPGHEGGWDCPHPECRSIRP